MASPTPFEQRLIIRDGQWTCGYCSARIENEIMRHAPQCRMVRPVPAETADQGSDRPDFELDIVVDLKELRLRHEAKSGCKCRGIAHEMTIVIDPADHDLHPAYDCVAAEPDTVQAAVQVLHEQAHPEGTLYAENCRERGCDDLGAA